MNKMVIFSTVLMASTLFACAGSDEPSEKTGSSEDKVSVSCLQSINAPYGSDEYWQQFQNCLNQPNDNYGGGGSGGGNVNQNCSISVSCFNGACTCGSGPNAGQACDGNSTCNDICRVCQ